jgi:hypothetical protein
MMLTRKVGVSVRILRPNFQSGAGDLDLSNPWNVICGTDIELSNESTFDDAWSQVGLDFTTDFSEVWIANPENGKLYILDTQTNELVVSGGAPLTITVGAEPFDVEILEVKDAAGSDVDRAYVANHGDDTMHIIDVINRQSAILDPVDLTVDFGGLTDLRIETMAGTEVTQRLFLVSPNLKRVFQYSLEFDPAQGSHGDNPDPQDPFIVGRTPRRVGLQK